MLSLKTAELIRLTSNLAVQNDAIKALQTDSAQAKKALEEKNTEAAKRRKDYDDRVAKILKLKVGATCEEALLWGVQQGQLQGSWQ